MKNETFEIAILSEPRIKPGCKLSKIMPLLQIEAILLKVNLHSARGLKKAKRALNRSIVLN